MSIGVSFLPSTLSTVLDFSMFSFLNGNLLSINIFFTDSSIVPIPYVPNFGLLLLSIENFDLNSKDNICLVD